MGEFYSQVFSCFLDEDEGLTILKLEFVGCPFRDGRGSKLLLGIHGGYIMIYDISFIHIHSQIYLY